MKDKVIKKLIDNGWDEDIIIKSYFVNNRVKNIDFIVSNENDRVYILYIKTYYSVPDILSDVSYDTFLNTNIHELLAEAML